MAAPRAERAAAVGVFLLAAAYFALGATLGLEWTDEGQIVYPSWLVSRGALPYRDFRHGYGPSLFLGNGLLLRAFGADLLVIRISLVLLKAAVAVLVWSLARRVTTPGFALAAAALLAALWGGPWWIFNAPYANHYGLALALAGLLAFLALQRRFLLACALAGLCCGVAATFKQTNGVFSFVPIALFILCEPYLSGSAPPSAPAPRWCVAALRALRAAALLGVLALCAAYAAPGSDAWTLAALLAPMAATLAVLARRVWRDPAAGDARRALAGGAAAALGFAAPLIGYAAYYGARGQLGELLFNVSELLWLVRWFEPLPRPPLRASLMVALLLLAYAALVWPRAAAGDRGRRTARAAIGGAAPVAVAVLAAAWGGSEWFLDAFRVLFFVPFVVTALSLAWFVRRRAAFWNPPALPAARQPALALLHLNAAASLLYLYPAADFWHLAMIWPAFLPLLAYQLACAHAAAVAPPAARWVARGLLAFVVLGLLLPQVAALAAARREHRAAAAAPFARASRITGTTRKFADAALLVRRLDELDPQAGPVLIVSNEQLLYFLSGRLSPVGGDEFVLYLVGAGLIDDADAQRLLPERRIVERLRATGARVVDVADNPMSARFYRTYPGVLALLAAEYEPESSAGAYRVLRRRQDLSQQAPRVPLPVPE